MSTLFRKHAKPEVQERSKPENENWLVDSTREEPSTNVDGPEVLVDCAVASPCLSADEGKPSALQVEPELCGRVFRRFPVKL